MEYNFSKHSVGCRNNFLDTVNEQIVDTDITLPDYCPDIEKILKCTLIPKVYTRTISGGQLTIDGVSDVRILYCDSIKHNIRSFTQSVPFTANFSLKSTPEQYVVFSNTKCEYINCRALSPRKLVVHGAFSLYAKVYSRNSLDFYSFDEECDLQTKQRELVVSDLSALCQEQFSVTQDISFSSKPPIEALLTYDVNAVITEVKSIHNKIMLNAQLNLKMMYLSDLDCGKTEHVSYVFDINRIIDCDGVLDDTVNIPTLEIMSSDLIIRNDNMNDGTLLTLDVKMCFSDLSYIAKPISVVDDAYSIEYAIEQKRSMCNFETNHTLENISQIVKSTLKLDSVKIVKVLDIYPGNVSISPVMSDGELSVAGKTNICILVEDADSVPSYIERNVDIDFKVQPDREFDRVQFIDTKVHSLSFRLVDDSTIELRIELRVCAVLCDSVSVNPVTMVVADEEKPIEHDDCSLILHFADKGESVWNIAKMYSTKASVLMDENLLADDEVGSAQMLLVPIQ